jgi:DNA-directed RNA polymerase alpha subunit
MTSFLDIRGMGQPARRALNEAGFKSLEELTRITEKEVQALHGMGPKALSALRDSLAEKGLSFKKSDA